MLIPFLQRTAFPFLEARFGVRFEAHEVSVDYLDTIAEIAATVRAKLAGAAP